MTKNISGRGQRAARQIKCRRTKGGGDGGAFARVGADTTCVVATPTQGGHQHLEASSSAKDGVRSRDMVTVNLIHSSDQQRIPREICLVPASHEQTEGCDMYAYARAHRGAAKRIAGNFGTRAGHEGYYALDWGWAHFRRESTLFNTRLPPFEVGGVWVDLCETLSVWWFALTIMDNNIVSNHQR